MSAKAGPFGFQHASAMTAVSSFRPLNACDEVARNQIRAFHSWRSVFTEILYFGTAEPQLSAPAVQFIPCDPFPPISALALAASMGSAWSALINADIVVAPNLLRVIPEACARYQARAITSRRWQFEKGKLANAKLVDFGYDFFMAERTLWAEIARKVPRQYRIGHSGWDTWILGWFNKTISRQFVDITSRRCIYHPKHENRFQPHTFEIAEDVFGQAGGTPRMQL